MVVSSTNLDRQFKQAFNNLIADAELTLIYQQLEIIEPNPGQLFWNSENSEAGIYFILAGKVRLLDREDNLIVSLPEGLMFAQSSLFLEANLCSHAARAGLGLKLGYLDAKTLQKLIKRSPLLEGWFYQQALKWDLLIISQKTGHQKEENLLELLPLLQQNNLTAGTLPLNLLQDKVSWILRQGEIIHSSGFKLASGKLYDVTQLPQGGEWLVTRPTELYSLDRAAEKSSSSLPPTGSDRCRSRSCRE